MSSPFFALPRELRDQIYSHLITPTKEIVPENASEVFDSTPQYTFSAPVPSLLLINKQFTAEYLDLLPASRKLTIIGDTSDHFTCFPRNNHAFANLIRDLTIYIHIKCYCDHMSPWERVEFFEDTGVKCDGADFIDFYKIKISETLHQYPNLQTLQVKLGLWGATDKPIDWPLNTHTPPFAQTLEAMVGLRGLKRIEVVKCPSPDDYWHYVREIVFRWVNKRTGKAEYRLGRGTHHLETFGTYLKGSGWEGGNGRKTAHACESEARKKK